MANVDVETCLRAGRQAIAMGKIEQALTILSTATVQYPDDPRTWFALAGLQLRQGHGDVAALCFQKSCKLSLTAGAQVIAETARDNALLAAVPFLPRDLLPLTTSTTTAQPWTHALDILAQMLVASGGTAVVAGAMGVPAAQLAKLCLDHSSDDATGSWHVLSCHANQLTGLVARQLAVANCLEGSMTVLEGGDLRAQVLEWVRVPVDQAGDASSQDRDVKIEGAPAQLIKAVVMPEACTAQFDLLLLRKTLEQVVTADHIHGAQAMTLCPRQTAIYAALVESSDLVDMNEVNLGHMREDTGLEYGPCNELLWRPSRSMPIDRLRYRLLSQPFRLLSVNSDDLALELTSHASSTGQPPLAPAVPKRPWTVDACCCQHGRLDCVVAWVECELLPGVKVSYAPVQIKQQRADNACAVRQEVAEGKDDGWRAGAEYAVLNPHVWQRVHYQPMKPQVVAGQVVQLHVTLTGNDLRLELDEDSLVGLPADPDRKPTLDMGMGARGDGAQGEGPIDSADAEADQGVGDLPAGDPIVSDSSESGSDGDDIIADGEVDDEGRVVHGARMILPYHICMLNDRQRTVMYRDGIQGALQQVLSAAPVNTTPWVLDVGAGTGLLSMMAAQAGCDAVIGVERELPLAMTALTLINTNDLSDRTTTLNTLSNRLVLTESSLPQEQHESGAQADDGPPSPTLAITTTQINSTISTVQASEGVVDSSSRGLERVLIPSVGANVLPAGGAVQALPGSAGGYWGVSCAPSLVVHEVFGSDPLSEQILTTMRDVKARLCGPNTRFMPGRFRVVAALAHSQSLYRARCALPPSTGMAGGAPNQRAQTLHLNLDALIPWTSTRVVCDVVCVPDMMLLTHPTPVLLFDLDLPSPPALQGEALVELTACAPTPITMYASSGSCLPATGSAARTAEAGSQARVAAAADVAVIPTNDVTGLGVASDLRQQEGLCSVYWFEVDCGEGGWLSTGPGHTYYGHWSQCVDFGFRTVGQGKLGASEAQSTGPGTEATGVDYADGYLVRAAWVVDRVRIRLLDEQHHSI